MNIHILVLTVLFFLTTSSFQLSFSEESSSTADMQGESLEKNDWQVYHLTTEDGQKFRIPYKIDGGQIDYMQDLKLKDIPVFKKFLIPSIKINGVQHTLTDDHLLAGPRIEIDDDQANTFVSYEIGNDIIRLFWLVNAGSGTTGSGAVQPFVKFELESSKNIEAIQYIDYDIGSISTNDKAIDSSNPAVVFNTEQKITGSSVFKVRDDLDSVTPWLEVGPGADSTITKWILKQKSLEPPTDDPDTYFSSIESINPNGSGENSIAYYLGGKTSSFHFSGPTINVHWTNIPTVACLPPTDDWIINSDCTLESSSVAQGNVVVDNNAVLTIPAGITLDIDFLNNHLLVKDGSGVLIKNGGTIT